MKAQSERPVYVDEAEGRAAALRHELGLGSDALGDVFELVEHLGLEVLRWPMGERGPDGFYLRNGDLALAVINSDKRFGRQRFTAAHELAHHLFDKAAHIDTDLFAGRVVPELRANAFAAYFLMPGEGVRRWIEGDVGLHRLKGPLETEAIVHMCRHFGISYEATLFQLRALGWLRPREVDALRGAQPERIARWLGYSLEQEAAEQGRRVLPPNYIRLALRAYAAGDVSFLRLAELLRLDERSARALVDDAGVEPPDVGLDDLVAEARRA
jgi:Zn-dependent peptidase ImmA (M78 family)